MQLFIFSPVKISADMSARGESPRFSAGTQPTAETALHRTRRTVWPEEHPGAPRPSRHPVTLTKSHPDADIGAFRKPPPPRRPAASPPGA